MTDRTKSAEKIVADGKIRETDDGFVVSGSADYHVSADCDECTCPDYVHRRNDCKHCRAARIVRDLQAIPF